MTRIRSGDRRVVVARLVLALSTVVVLLPTAAMGQTPTDRAQTVQDANPEDGRARLTVTGFTGVLGPGSVPTTSASDPLSVEPTPDRVQVRALVENDGAVALDALRLVVEMYPSVPTRGRLRQALEGDVGEQPLHIHDPSVRDGEPLAPGEIEGVVAAFGRDEVAWGNDPAGAVHPVRIAVQRGTEVLDEVITAVVRLSQTPEEPILTTMTWPVDGPPMRDGNGAYASGAGRAFRQGGRLDVLLRTIQDAPSAPVVLAPAAHLLEDLGDRSDGFVVLERQADGTVERRDVAATDSPARSANRNLQRIREIADRLRLAPVAGAYADADLPALVEAGPTLRQIAAEAAAEGRRRTQLELGTEIDRSAYLVDGPLSPEALDLLPGETLLLPYATTTGPDLGEEPDLDPPIQPLTTPSGRLLTAIVADPYLVDALDAMNDETGPVIGAHRVVAETAMAYLEEPDQPGRTMLMLPPSAWSPTPRGAQLLLEALSSATWVKLTSPGELAEKGRRSDSEAELAPSPAGPFDPAFATDYRRTAESLESVMAALPEGGARIGGQSASDLHDALLRAGSRWYRGPLASEATTIIRDIEQSVDATFGDVTIAGGGVTLTSNSGTIPVTLQRTRGGPIRVAVEVESQGRLLWPEGRRSEPLLLTDESSQTVSFSTEALSTGTFPVTVRVVDPTGERELARTGISVRSNAVSQPALIATATTVVLLLGIAGWRRRGRRRRRLEVVG